jgi:hypothetical protein
VGPLYSIEFLLLLCFAAGYYKAADIENASGILWAGLSALIFFTTWRLLGWGLFGDLIGQAALLGGITAVRVIREFRNST